MPEKIKKDDFSRLENMLAHGQVREFYSYLKEHGYAYAGWGRGVAMEDSISGISAIDYLTGSALMGMGGEACWNITPDKSDKIKQEMADAYLNTLEAIAEKTLKTQASTKLTETSTPKRSGIFIKKYSKTTA